MFSAPHPSNNVVYSLGFWSTCLIRIESISVKGPTETVSNPSFRVKFIHSFYF